MPPNTPSLGVGVASKFDSLGKCNGVGGSDAYHRRLSIIQSNLRNNAKQLWIIVVDARR
jgi:hypothetical protein